MKKYSDDKYCLFPKFDNFSVQEVVDKADSYLWRQAKVAEFFGNKRFAFSGFNLRGPHLAAYRIATGFAVRTLNKMGAAVTIHGPDGDSKKYNPVGQPSRPEVKIFLPYKEGELVYGGGKPMIYMYGLYQDIANLETGILQRIGGPSIVASISKEMSSLHPAVPFVEMGARHCVGTSHPYYAYGIWVGSEAAKREFGATGFIGTSTNEANSAFWGDKEGRGTTAHKYFNVISEADLIAAAALGEEAGDIVRGCKMYQQVFPEIPVVGLVDTFGREITDAVALYHAFNDEAKAGRLFVRLDTAGERYPEGLDKDKAHDIIQRKAPWMFARYLDKEQMTMLTGQGVSIAAIFHQREQMDLAGAKEVKILPTSGFNLKKLMLAHEAKAPADMYGTGSWEVYESEAKNAKDESMGAGEPEVTPVRLRTKAGRAYMIEPWKVDSAKFGWSI